MPAVHRGNRRGENLGTRCLYLKDGPPAAEALTSWGIGRATGKVALTRVDELARGQSETGRTPKDPQPWKGGLQRLRR